MTENIEVSSAAKVAPVLKPRKLTTEQLKDKTIDLQTRKDALKLQLAENHARDRKPVRGIFRFHEVRGGVLKFSFREYLQDPIETHELTDGQISEIPFGVARHLNKNCFYTQHIWKDDERGIPQQVGGHKTRRCSFQSLDFMDNEALKDMGDVHISIPVYTN